MSADRSLEAMQSPIRRIRHLGDAIPTGTISVGVGLVISSITAYAFVVVTLNALDGSA